MRSILKKVSEENMKIKTDEFKICECLKEVIEIENWKFCEILR